MTEVGFGSNYVWNTSNILVPRIMQEVGFGSNYVLSTSNILVKRITDEVRYTSNYVERLIVPLTNYWTTDGATNIYLNQAGNVGIGTQTSLTNKLQVQGTISASGLITGNAGITVPSGQTLTSAGTLTASIINASGLITGNAGITIPTGQTLTLSGTANISANTMTTSGLITANGGISTSGTGLITANNGITIPLDKLLNANGGIAMTTAPITPTTTPATIFNMIYDARNGLRIQQRYITTDDIMYQVVQRYSGVDAVVPSLVFRAGSVGIGTTPSITKILDVFGNVNVSNGAITTRFMEVIPSVITSTVPSTITSTPAYANYTPSNALYKCAIFKYRIGAGITEPALGSTYNITIPDTAGILCDILMVGGGGAGGKDIGSGGGGGAVLYGQNIFIPAGSYTLVVAGGARGSIEARGYSTTGFGATILGGGSAGFNTWANAVYVNSGGSGGGGKSVGDLIRKQGGGVGVSTKGALLSDATLYNGNKGGQGADQSNQVASAGGGGANGVGGNGSGGAANSVNVGGAGIGIAILDNLYYWGGGGAGGCYISNPSVGGIGGGGAGQRCDGNTAVAYVQTNGLGCMDTTQPYGYTDPKDGCYSSGGGGGGTGYNYTTSGNGGTGVIIIRYRRPLPATAVVDYLKGDSPSVADFKAGMVGGDYKIQSIQSTTTRDRFVVNASSGSVHIGESALVVKSTGEVNISSVLNTKSLLIDGVVNQFSTLTSRPTMWMGSATGNGPSSTNDINIYTSSVYNYFVVISINDLVISYSIIWKNNLPLVTNYWTFNDGSYYVSLVQNLGFDGQPTTNRYTFWRRSGTFVWRVQEFL